MNGIDLKSGVNNCFYNFKGKCTCPSVTRNEKARTWDFDSKMNCTLTIIGVHQCSAYKPEGLMGEPLKVTYG